LHSPYQLNPPIRVADKISRKTVPFSIVLRRTRRRKFVALIRCKHTTMPLRYQAASQIFFALLLGLRPHLRNNANGFTNARYKKLEGFVLQWNRIVGIVRKMFIRLSEHQVRSEVRGQKSEVRDQNFSVVCLLSSVLLMEGDKYEAEESGLSGFCVTCVISVT
jgi:hypothetical protein